MKKRFLLPLLLFFLPATIISAAYAGFVYSNKVDTESVTNQGKIDDVKPNFKLDENNYTIYFFPSMQPADIEFDSTNESEIINKIDSAKPRSDDYNPWFGDKQFAWGYWEDSNSNDIIGQDTTNNKKYYPKKIETHGGPSISLEQFSSIGDPVTKGKDDKPGGGVTLDFCGWTAVRAASTGGYKSQGDFAYFSAFDDLTKIDEAKADGTKIGDKTIFLYPIFTTGKDYDNKKNSVRISSDESTRYLSQSNDDYYFYNLVIDGNKKWNLNFAGTTTTALNSWYSDWPAYRQKEIDGIITVPNPFFDPNDLDNSVVKEKGIYNVYVYLQKQSSYNAFNMSKAKESVFYNEKTSNNVPLIHDDNLDDINSDKKINDYRIKCSNWGSTRYFWMFVKVEKVYEFKLAGTEGRGFTFDTAGQLYVSSFNSAKFKTLKDSNGVNASTKYPLLDNSLWKMYYLDNVFMEKGKNNIFAEYINPTSNAIYKIRNTVFSILPSDESLSGIADGLQAMGGTDDVTLKQELDFINEFEIDENVKGNYLGASVLLLIELIKTVRQRITLKTQHICQFIAINILNISSLLNSNIRVSARY